MDSNTKQSPWTLVIKPQTNLLSIDFAELWRYRDLYLLLIKRDIVTQYKQTILGPIWYFVQPVMTTAMYMVVFGGIAKIPTDGVPQPLFYLAGICSWQYFSDCLGKTCSIFITNANVFSKVYFPRLVVPLAYVTSGLLKFFIQFLLFVAIYIYYLYIGADVHLTWCALLLPLLILIMASQSLGVGIVFSSLTTKYRDLTFLLSFFVQLWMYATPVIYPLSTITNPKLKMVMMANPLTGVLEAFKYGLLGAGEFSWSLLGYSFGFSFVLLSVGIIIFNRIQRNFIDTV